MGRSESTVVAITKEWGMAALESERKVIVVTKGYCGLGMEVDEER